MLREALLPPRGSPSAPLSHVTQNKTRCCAWSDPAAGSSALCSGKRSCAGSSIHSVTCYVTNTACPNMEDAVLQGALYKTLRKPAGQDLTWSCLVHGANRGLLSGLSGTLHEVQRSHVWSGLI